MTEAPLSKMSTVAGHPAIMLNADVMGIILDELSHPLSLDQGLQTTGMDDIVPSHISSPLLHKPYVLAEVPVEAKQHLSACALVSRE